MKQVYLDYAAASPLDPDVLVAMKPYLYRHFYNPSAIYTLAREAKQSLEDARGGVAKTLGVKSSEIIFTSGGTEANNQAIFGLVRQYPGSSLVISNIEHDSVYEPAKVLEREEHDVRYLPVDSTGIVISDKLSELISEDTILVSVMLANNEIGTLQPIKELAMVIEKVRAERRRKGNLLPLILHTDACQATNYIDVSPHRLQVDLMTINSSKIYGPKRCAFLYVRAGVRLLPVIYGGGQEKGLRSGTEPISDIVGLYVAFKKACALRKAENERLKGIQKLTAELLQSRVPGIEINGNMKYRLPNNLHINVRGWDNERLVYLLDELGYMVATGSACSSASIEPSRVLGSIGKADRSSSSLRISMGRQTRMEDMKRFVATLRDVVS